LDRSKLDSELAEALIDFPVLDIWADIPTARELGAEIVKQIQSELPQVDGVTTSDHIIPGPIGAPEVSVRVYRPDSSDEFLPALLWIHGGGYVLGSLQGDDYTVKCLVENVGSIVVSVEYRLAPEHPYPAPLEDCYAALMWLATHTDELGVDATRIAIGGISAGGGLAAGLAILARDRAEMNVMFQMLFCPMIDDRNSTPSSYAITDPHMWNRDDNEQGWAAYLGGDGDSDKTSEYAAAARAENLSDLPPAYIPVGSLDLFLDENIEYAKRLNQAGVPAELHVFPGGFHAFEFLVPTAEISKRAMTMHYEILRQAFRIYSN
jgi:acetyl esterase/lipase